MKILGIDIHLDFHAPPTESDDAEVNAAFTALGDDPQEESEEFARWAHLRNDWHQRGYTPVVQRGGDLFLLDNETLDDWVGDAL